MAGVRVLGFIKQTRKVKVWLMMEDFVMFKDMQPAKFRFDSGALVAFLHHFPPGGGRKPNLTSLAFFTQWAKKY